MNLRKILIIISFFAFIALAISCIPIYKYYYHFKGFPTSDNPSDWGVFGDYIGGTSGTLLSFFAVFFSLISLYFSLRISTIIQESEFKFVTEQAKQSLKLLHTQNKPYLYLDLEKFPHKTMVIIQNQGVGPLIIKEWKLKYGEIEYLNFSKLFKAKSININRDTFIHINTAPTHILAPSTEKILLEIKPEKHITEQFSELQKEIRTYVKDFEIIIQYEDIFENKFDYKQNLGFLRT